jgi:putative spermidine/putrescine transport system permease protein
MEHQSLTQAVGAAAVRPARSISPTARAWLFLTPSMLFLGVLIAASLLVLRMSVGTKGAEWSGFSLGSYAQLLEPYYLKSLLLTLRLALISALIAVILAIPVAYTMSRLTSPFVRRIFLAAVLLPLLVNLLLQSYGWLVILGPAGMLNQTLMGLGLIKRPIMLLYNQNGVLMGLVQTAFPARRATDCQRHARCRAQLRRSSRNPRCQPFSGVPPSGVADESARESLLAQRWSSPTTPAVLWCRCCSVAVACRCSQ